MKSILLDHKKIPEKYYLSPERSRYLIFLAVQSHKKRKQAVRLFTQMSNKNKSGKPYSKYIKKRLEDIVHRNQKSLKPNMCIRNSHLGQNGSIITPYSFTITCTEIPHVVVGEGKNQRIRMLTPYECEQLQNFPANYTRFAMSDDKKKYELSDSARYKAIGDAVNSRMGKAVIEEVLPEGGKIVKLFAGINGTGALLDKNKYPTLVYCEKMKIRREVIRLHDHEAMLLDDVKKLNRENFKEDFDLLVATHPCQSFSKAGNGAGLEDDNGLLFFEIIRILEEYRPPKFICENVPGLIEHDKGETFKKIQEYIRKAGYSFEYKICNARQYGSEQNRTRVIYWGSSL